MRRGPVQDRTLPLQRQQTLSRARRHSLSDLFQLLHDFAPKKGEQRKQKRKKRAVSAEGEEPATAETTDPILVPSRLLRVGEAPSIQYEGSLKIEKGGQGFRKSLPTLPGQDRWEGALET